MKIVVNTFAYTHSDLLLQMVDSLGLARVKTKTAPVVSLYLHDHSYKEDVHWMCDYIQRSYVGVRVFDWRVNRGTGKSINDTFIAAFDDGQADVVINANDDTRWAEGAIKSLATYALDNPTLYAVQGSAQLQLAAAAFNRVAWEKVGCFDENFAPCPYFEDIDWLYRGKLLGLEVGTYPEGLDIWHFGSATLKHDPEYQKVHDGLFIGNRAYYVSKWGGMPGYETFTTPFNQPDFGLYIAPEQRAAPYGNFDRRSA